MQNKTKLLAVALFSLLAVTGCDEVVAKPTDYNENIVLNNDGTGLDVPNNEMAKVYDAIRNGSLASDVLNEFLYQYAVSAFGAYNHVTAGADVLTLKDVAKLIIASCSTAGDYDTINADSLKSSKANEFVKNHKAYWTINDAGKRIQYNNQNEAIEVADDADADKLEYTRVITKWETIEDRIAKTLYANVSSGSYNTRNVFEEKEFLYSLYGNMKNVANPNNADVKAYTGLIWPEVEDVDVFNENSKVDDIDGNKDTLLHRENYQQNYALDATESSNNTVTYVEDDIVPEIYRTMLTEQYVYDENYQLLGRSYARKVNIIKLTGSTTYTKGASYMMDAFIKGTIFNAEHKAAGLEEFKLLSNAYNGAFMSDTATYAASDEYAIWEAAGLTSEYVKTAKDGTKYIVGTAYGDMMENYDKIDNNPAISQNESDFTGNGAYTKEVGKEIQTREILVKDLTTTGWYIKNGGLGDLPESIRSRLFNISVANAINRSSADKLANDRATTDGYDATKDFNNYVARINGKNYLKIGQKASDADPMNDILFVDGNNYYIVQIEEAASSSTLDKTAKENAHTYLALDDYGPAAMEEIVNEVCTIVADSDSYRTLAKKSFLEQANLKYHDQVIYDYFKSNFPELF